MAYVIELHDDDFDPNGGTLLARIGRRNGTIEFPYQAEMHLHAVLNERWRRAYLMWDNRIASVWARDMATGELRYVARAKDYRGEWVLPFVGLPDAHIAVGVWGRDATTRAEAHAWASGQLHGAITAVLLDRDGEIYGAWELTPTSPRLVASGRRKQH